MYRFRDQGKKGVKRGGKVSQNNGRSGSPSIKGPVRKKADMSQKESALPVLATS